MFTPLPPPYTTTTQIQFLLEVDEVAGLAQQLEAWRRDIYQPLVIEVFAHHVGCEAVGAHPGGSSDVENLLERWTLRYGPLSPGAQAGQSSATRAGSDDAAVYKRMVSALFCVRVCV